MLPSPQETEGHSAASPSSLGHKLRRRILLILFILAAIYCAFDLHRFLDAVEREDRTPTLERWLPFAAELGSDDRLYDDHPDYLYPPFFLVLLRPLTHLPAPMAAVIWQLAKYASIIGTFRLTWSILARAMPTGAALPLWCKAASVIVAIRFIASDLTHGNVNIFLGLFVVLAAWLLLRGRPFAAGLLVAAAAAIKVTPALWAVYLLYKRRWIASAGVIVGLILALEVVPLLVMPPATNHALLGRWYHHVVSSFVAEGKIYSPYSNQSLAGVTNRLLGRAEWSPGEPPATIIDLPDSVLTWLQRAIAAALVAGLAWACRGRRSDTDAFTFAVEWSLIAPVTLILSGYTWTGHFCLLVLPQAVLLAHFAWTGRRCLREATAWLAISAFSLWFVTSDIITGDGRRWCSKMGLPLLAVLLIIAALAVLRRRLDKAQTAPNAASRVAPARTDGSRSGFSEEASD